MKMLLALGVLAAVVACVSPTNQAAESSKDKPAQAPKSGSKARQMPFRGKISAVDKTAKTITLEGKEKGRTFQITSATKITKDAKPAVLDDVTVGETVGGLAKENAAGKWVVVSLNVGARAGKAKRGEKNAEK
jgi:hypothetical protein